MGKTALALSLARNASVEFGHSVGFFSLEMSNQQLAERLITAEARVDSHLVRTGRLPKNEWKKLSAAAGPLSEAKIYIDDSAGLNIMELRAKARQLNRAVFPIPHRIVNVAELFQSFFISRAKYVVEKPPSRCQILLAPNCFPIHVFAVIAETVFECFGAAFIESPVHFGMSVEGFHFESFIISF